MDNFQTRLQVRWSENAPATNEEEHISHCPETRKCRVSPSMMLPALPQDQPFLMNCEVLFQWWHTAFSNYDFMTKNMSLNWKTFSSSKASRYNLPAHSTTTALMPSQLLHSPSLPSTPREDDVQRELAHLFRPYHVPIGSGRGPAQRRKRKTPW